MHGFYGRAAADTYPAYYPASNPSEIARLAHSGGMDLVELRIIPDPTYLAFRPFLFRLASRVESSLPADRAIHLVGPARRH